MIYWLSEIRFSSNGFLTSRPQFCLLKLSADLERFNFNRKKLYATTLELRLLLGWPNVTYESQYSFRGKTKSELRLFWSPTVSSRFYCTCLTWKPCATMFYFIKHHSRYSLRTGGIVKWPSMMFSRVISTEWVWRRSSRIVAAGMVGNTSRTWRTLEQNVRYWRQRTFHLNKASLCRSKKETTWDLEFSNSHEKGLLQSIDPACNHQ